MQEIANMYGISSLKLTLYLKSFFVASFTSWIHHTCMIDMEALVKPKKIPAYLHKNKILMYSENIP